MNLAALRTTAQAIMQIDLDWFNADPVTGQITTANMTAAVNSAQALIARVLMQPFTQVALTYSATCIFDLETVFSRRMLHIHSVFVNGTVLNNWFGKPGPVTLQQLEVLFPNWMSAAGTLPQCWVQSGRQLILVPAGGAPVVTVYGAGYPVDLVNDNDFPELPDDIVEMLPFLTAIYAARPMIAQDAAWARLQEYKATAVAQITEAANRNRVLLGLEPLTMPEPPQQPQQEQR